MEFDESNPLASTWHSLMDLGVVLGMIAANLAREQYPDHVREAYDERLASITHWAERQRAEAIEFGSAFDEEE